MKRLAVSIVFLTALFCGCNKSVEYIPGPIDLSPVIGYETRAEAVFSDFPSSESFQLWGWDAGNDAYINNETISREGSLWRSAKFWPLSSFVVFEGVAARGAQLNITNADFGININGFKSPEAGIDLLYAPKTHRYSRGDDAPVALHFDHALAKVDLRAQNGMPNEVMMRLDRVTLRKVHTEGSFSTANGSESWNVTDAVADFDYVTPDKPVMLTDEMEYLGDYRLFVPQNGKIAIDVEFSFSLDGEVWIEHQKMTTGEFDAEWMIGNYITYSLVITQFELGNTRGISNWNNRI